MSLGLEAIVNQQVIREKAHLLRREIIKAVQDAAAIKTQLSAANDQIVDLKGQVRSYEERTAQLERELEDSRAY